MTLIRASSEQLQLPPPSDLVQLYLSRLPEGVMVDNRRLALDVGCGEGRNSIAMAERGFTVTAIDPNLRILRTAAEFRANRRLSSSACQFMGRSALDIASLRDEYGVVMCNEVLHMMPRQEQHEALRLMRERTVQGGKNLISGYMIPPEIMAKPLTELSEKEQQIRDHLLFPGWLKRLYESAGWDVNFARDIPRPTQIIGGKHSVFSKSYLIARKPQPYS